MVTEPQVSLAVTLASQAAILVACCGSAHSSVRSAGQVIVGAVVSLIIILALQLA